jgi:peroxiredoxin
MKTCYRQLLFVPLVSVALGVLAAGCGVPPDGTSSQRDQAGATAEAPSPGDAAPRTGAPTLTDSRIPVRPVGEEPPVRRVPAPPGSRVQVGQEAPDFELTTTDGQKFKLSEQRGKVVLLNFFATWCVPCLHEMPLLQRDVYEKIKGGSFAMIAVGREHDNAEVAAFRAKHRLGFPMAGDPHRAVFALYAEKSIPRTLVIDRDGRALFQSAGYSDKDFQEMLTLLRKKIASR